MSSLKDQAYKGVFWTLMEKFSNQGLQFVTGIVLARILTPEEFGLVGMVTVFIVISAVFVDSGFGMALINKSETDKKEESSVFWLNIGISVVVFGVLFFAAPLIAGFYEEPILIDITRVLGLMLILQAFGAIHLNLLSKELDFKTQFKMTLSSNIVSGIVGISAALTGYGVWAIVVQRLVQVSWQSTGLWILHSWRPRMQLSFKALKPLWRYGSKLLMARLITTFFENIYSLVIGKSFSASALGFYRRAKGFQSLPLSFLTTTIGKVSFPLYSKVKDNLPVYKAYMRQSLALMTFISFPVFIALAAMAKPVIVLLITDKWLPAVPYLQWLCIVGMLHPWQLMNVQSIVAYGRSDLNFNLALVKNMLRLVNLVVMMNFSVLYIIIGEVIISILALFINTYYTKRLFDYGILKQVADVSRNLWISILTGLAMLVPFSFKLSYIPLIILQLVIFGALTLALNYLFNKTLLFEVVSNLKKLNRKKNE